MHWVLSHNLFLFAEANANLPKDQFVFVNNMVTFKFCSTLSPISYTINELRSHSLPEDFKNKVTFDSNSFPCHFLSFPAWLEYDGAHIQFHFKNGSSRIATLHIQGLLFVTLPELQCYSNSCVGILGPPRNLRNKKINSTHDSLIWDDPPSLLGHDNTTYQVVLNFRHFIEAVSVSSLRYVYLRRSGPVMASVTSWNPVGEGAMSTLNFSNGCQNIGKI